jgi:hypothetical protein
MLLPEPLRGVLKVSVCIVPEHVCADNDKDMKKFPQNKSRKKLVPRNWKLIGFMGSGCFYGYRDYGI